MEAIDSPMDEQRHGGASGERGMGRESAAAAAGESRRFFLPSVSSFPLLFHYAILPHAKRGNGREGKGRKHVLQMNYERRHEGVTTRARKKRRRRRACNASCSHET